MGTRVTASDCLRPDRQAVWDGRWDAAGARHPHEPCVSWLPGDPLIELVRRGALGLGVEWAARGLGHVPGRRAARQGCLATIRFAGRDLVSRG